MTFQCIFFKFSNAPLMRILKWPTPADRCRVEPRYNAVVGVHDFGARRKRGALGVPISATRELLNNSDRRQLHQVHERCQSHVCLQQCPIRQHAVYGIY